MPGPAAGRRTPSSRGYGPVIDPGRRRHVRDHRGGPPTVQVSTGTSTATKVGIAPVRRCHRCVDPGEHRLGWGRVRCRQQHPDQRLGAVAVPGLAACGVPEQLVPIGEHVGRPGADQGGGPGQRTPAVGGDEHLQVVVQLQVLAAPCAVIGLCRATRNPVMPDVAPVSAQRDPAPGGRRAGPAPCSTTAGPPRSSPVASTRHGNAAAARNALPGNGFSSGTSRAAACPTVSTRAAIHACSSTASVSASILVQLRQRRRPRRRGQAPEPGRFLLPRRAFLVCAFLTRPAQERVEAGGTGGFTNSDVDLGPGADTRFLREPGWGFGYLPGWGGPV